MHRSKKLWSLFFFNLPRSDVIHCLNHQWTNKFASNHALWVASEPGKSYEEMEISFALKETDYCVGREERRTEISLWVIAFLF